MSLRIEHPIGSLSQEEATQRLKVFGEYLQHKGIQVAWSGERATVRGKYMVVTIDGQLSFQGGKVIFEGKDPGFLWRGKAKDYLAQKLSLYLDPSRAVDELPRG